MSGDYDRRDLWDKVVGAALCRVFGHRWRFRVGGILCARCRVWRAR